MQQLAGILKLKAGFLFWIKRAITYKSDMVQAARKTVPILIGVPVSSFAIILPSEVNS